MYTCSLENSEVKDRPLDVYIFLVYFITVELLCVSVCVYESVHECVCALALVWWYRDLKILSLLK